MAKKTELLLVKATMVEATLEALTTRQQRVTSDLTQQPLEQKAAGLFERVMSLTAPTIVNGIAVIPLRGMITPDDPYAVYYGETTLADFTGAFKQAVADPAVKAIVLNIFSPGGYVYGVEAAANLIYQARGAKPIISYTDSLAASAAYWLASAADKIVLGSDTAEVGSIGVYMVHFDYSGMIEKMGIKVTEITSGEFKGIGSPYAAMTPAEQKVLQADSNYVYTRFVNTVARNRGMAVAAVLKSANGLTFYGEDAVKAGLADSINTFQEVMDMAVNEKTALTPEQEKEQNDAATAEKAKLEGENAALKAQVQAFEAKEATASAEKSAAECNTAIKAAFGRAATAEEVAHYASLDEAGKKSHAALLLETATSREKSIKEKGLEKEVATEGQDPEHSPDNNPLVLAARSLGLSIVAAK